MKNPKYEGLDMSNVPQITLTVTGRDFSTEAVVIVGLLRKLGVSEISLTELDLSPPKGLFIDVPFGKVVYQEWQDGEKEKVVDT